MQGKNKLQVRFCNVKDAKLHLLVVCAEKIIPTFHCRQKVKQYQEKHTIFCKLKTQY